MRLTVARSQSDFKLLMLSVVHRHGDRAPIREFMYPKSLYKNDPFYPYGDGALTNLGKRQMYDVGVALRKKYDQFLGKIYLPDDLQVITSSIDRTKMSTLLLCAALYPPVEPQKWDDQINWQPIPYTEIHAEKDMAIIRGPDGRRFPHFLKVYHEQVMNTQFLKDLREKYAKELEYLEEHTGYKNICIRDVYNLFQTLTAEVSLGKPLADWAKSLFPDKLDEIAANEYVLLTLTPDLKRYCAGTLARMILDEFRKKVNGLSSKKVCIYSGHETTVGFQLRLLDVFDNRVPPLACYIIWELLEKNSEYYIRILYQNYQQKDPKELKLIRLDDLCNVLEPTLPKVCPAI